MENTIKNKDLLDYTLDLLSQRRSYYEPQWYANLNGYENNHFIGWNQTSKTIQRFPSKKRFFVQFPEVTKQADGFQNLMMASSPVYQVYPTDFSNKAEIEQSRHQSLFLRQHYLDWHEDNVLHTLVHNAAVMPISFMEIAVSKEWDIESGSYIWTTVPRVYDAFDILFDPRFLFEQNPCVVKVIRTRTMLLPSQSCTKTMMDIWLAQDCRTTKRFTTSTDLGLPQPAIATEYCYTSAM